MASCNNCIQSRSLSPSEGMGIFDCAEDLQFLYFALILSRFTVQSSRNPAEPSRQQRGASFGTFPDSTGILPLSTVRHRHTVEGKKKVSGISWL